MQNQDTSFATSEWARGEGGVLYIKPKTTLLLGEVELRQ